MVKEKKCLILKIDKFWKFVKVSKLKIPNIWSFSKLVNHSNLGNYLIFQIFNFWGWGLELEKPKMRIGEIPNSAEYQMDEQNQNFANWKKNSRILQFRKSSNFHYWQTQKKNQFWNCWISKIS